MSPSVEIVIVNWNSGSALADCLRSIARTGEGCKLAGVIVVDNGSDDDSVSCCAGVDLPIQLIRNERNQGFARACNQGARIGSAPYLLFLNPDVRVQEAAIAETVAFLERPESAHIGLCGIRLTDDRGRDSVSCARLPRPGGLLAQAVGVDRWLPRLFAPQFMSREELQRSRTVEQITGALLLVRRSVYDALHGFDERFFLYYEEVDFCARARRLGVGLYFLSHIEAVHLGGWCSRRIGSRRLFYLLESRLKYAGKHFSRAGRVCVLIATLVAEPLARIAFACLRFSFRDIAYTFQAYAALYASMTRGRPAVSRRE